MSGMPGWSQDRIACHRMEIQKAPHCNFTGQIRGKQENCSKFAPKILWCSILCSRFRALFTCIPSGCCTEKGLSKVADAEYKISSPLFSSRLVSSLLFSSFRFSSLL